MKVVMSQATKPSKLPILKTPDSQTSIMLKSEEAKTPDSQTTVTLKSEEAKVKVNISIQKEDIKNEDKFIDVEELVITNEECSSNDVLKQISNEQIPTENVQKALPIQIEIFPQEKNTSNQTKEINEQKESAIKLTFEIEQASTKEEEERKMNDKQSKNDSEGYESLPVEDERKNGINEKEETQNQTQADTGNYSVDTTAESEISEISESTSLNNTKTDKADETVHNDASVSYDPTILLKDVQVRLNDCLKNNSKPDVSHAEDIINQLSKDVSFGKTLRNISGRHSISRTRSFREKRLSPNSSLFVNTSTMSIPQDEGIECKVLHYNSDLSDCFSTNGSSLDRKRKIDTAVPRSSMKKQKLESENSLLNTSINLLKGLRRPIQVSTLNITPCQPESSKFDGSGIKGDDNKIIDKPTENGRGWCLIM